MKRHTKLISFIGAAVSVVSLVAMAENGSHGTDILHYSVDQQMVNDGVEPQAMGRVQAQQNQQGNANNQQVSLSFNGLTADTNYLLQVNGDTNPADGISFTTDPNGSSRLQFRSQGNGHGNNGNGNNNQMNSDGNGGNSGGPGDSCGQGGGGPGSGNGQGNGHGNQPLPAALNPVSSVTQLDVFNTSSQAVLSADLTQPNQFEIQIKQSPGTNNVTSFLRIQSSSRRTRFDWRIFGLGPTNDYLLVANDSVVQTDTSDANGNLDIKSLPVSVNILDVTSLQLWDSSSNVVLSATLP